MKNILSIDEAAMLNPQTKKQMQKLQKKSGKSGASKKAKGEKKSANMTSIDSSIKGKIDTYGPKNESMLREKTKKQMEELNRTIKSAGGDIQDIVRKSEKTKEDKQPNTYYMDNPFDSTRTSIETQEHFVSHGAHDRSIAMKSRDPLSIRGKKKKKVVATFEDFSVNENVDSSLNTMNAHYQTFIFPRLTDEEQITIKKLDVIIFRYNYDNEVNVRVSFKSPMAKEDAYQLTLVNVTPIIYDDMIKITKKLGLESTYDGKNKLFLNIYYKNKKNPPMNRPNRPNRINESTHSDFLMSYGVEIKAAIKTLKQISKIYDDIGDGDFVRIDKKMKNYDDNVGDIIDGWAADGEVDADQIVRVALENYNDFGTEPQFILFAIEDWGKILSEYITNEEIKFSDGMEFDTSGPLRKEERSDGWYIVGENRLIPVSDEKEADEYLSEESVNEGADEAKYLTAKQKKLPDGLKKGIIARMKKSGKTLDSKKDDEKEEKEEGKGKGKDKEEKEDKKDDKKSGSDEEKYLSPKQRKLPEGMKKSIIAKNKKKKKVNEGKRDQSESYPSDDLKANFRSWEQDCDNEESAEELFNILSDRHPDFDAEELRQMAYDWVGCETPEHISYMKDEIYHGRSEMPDKYRDEFEDMIESVTESKKPTKTKKENFIPTKKLKNLKSFYEICADGDCTEKSDVNDDSWIKGKKEDFVRPMFKNLPDTTIRPSYDALRTGKMITLFGKECRVIGIKNGELQVSVMNDKTNEFETIKYDMKEVLPELKKNYKPEKEKKDKK